MVVITPPWREGRAPAMMVVTAPWREGTSCGGRHSTWEGGRAQAVVVVTAPGKEGGREGTNRGGRHTTWEGTSRGGRHRPRGPHTTRTIFGHQGRQSTEHIAAPCCCPPRSSPPHAPFLHTCPSARSLLPHLPHTFTPPSQPSHLPPALPRRSPTHTHLPSPVAPSGGSSGDPRLYPR